MKLTSTIIAISALFSGVFVMAAENPGTTAVKPTIALVHGAFEDSHVWLQGSLCASSVRRSGPLAPQR
jgi:hypothetical protein